jgi:hypothetical protein
MPQQAWGGDLKMPTWLRWLLRRPAPPGDTPERMHEARQPEEMRSVLENANRAFSGSLVDLYNEGHARKHAPPRGDQP